MDSYDLNSHTMARSTKKSLFWLRPSVVPSSFTSTQTACPFALWNRHVQVLPIPSWEAIYKEKCAHARLGVHGAALDIKDIDHIL
jgi:hypothetical protein